MTIYGADQYAARQVSPLPNATASGSHLRNEIGANEDVSMDQSDEDGDADDRMSVEDEDGQGNAAVSRLKGLYEFDTENVFPDCDAFKGSTTGGSRQASRSKRAAKGADECIGGQEGRFGKAKGL
jgi:hypothetical protein